MTTELLSQPKRHLALDMGWRTAAAIVLFFGICLLSTMAGAWRLLKGAPVSERITWQTVFLFFMGGWFAFIFRERTARFAALLVMLSSGSRALLAVVGASPQVRILNAEIMRAVEVVVMAGCCSYIGFWFKQRIRRI